MERLGTDRNETLVIGDRLDADIAAGQAVGCPTALVLTGVSTKSRQGTGDPRLILLWKIWQL